MKKKRKEKEQNKTEQKIKNTKFAKCERKITRLLSKNYDDKNPPKNIKYPLEE